jgi:hypothetical protein
LRGRPVITIKKSGTDREIWKARYVIQEHRDQKNEVTARSSTNVQQRSLRLIFVTVPDTLGWYSRGRSSCAQFFLAALNRTGLQRLETEGLKKHVDNTFFWHTQQFYFDDKVTPSISYCNQAISTPNATRDPGMARTPPSGGLVCELTCKITKRRFRWVNFGRHPRTKLLSELL